MNKVITISREFGSGGREIGIKLAEKLNIPFYDKELISMAAKQSSFAEHVLESAEEKAPDFFAYSVYSVYSMPMSDQVFLMQSKIIKQLAEKGPCIIVGRCADYVLKEMGSVNIFIYADIKSRIERKIKQNIGVAPEKMEEHIRSVDKKRKKYYTHYTGQNWGLAENHHLCVNSTEIGIDGCVEVILSYLSQLK